MSVEVDRRAALEDDLPQGTPVAVAAELDDGRAAAHLEGVHRKRDIRTAFDGNQHGDLRAVVGVVVGSLAAPRVAADDGEPVPAFRHLDVHFHHFGVDGIHEFPFAVDREREVVVELVLDVPCARLFGRHLEPAVEAKLGPVKPGILPAGVLPVEIRDVARAHGDVVANRRAHVPRRAADRIAVFAVEDASPLGRLRLAVAELDVLPREIRHAVGDAERRVSVHDHRGEVRRRHVREGIAVHVEAVPVRGVAEVRHVAAARPPRRRRTVGVELVGIEPVVRHAEHNAIQVLAVGNEV